MKIESVGYAIGDLACRGTLVYDDDARGEPLLLMAPNWLGVTRDSVAVAQTLARNGYVVFVADMYGEGNGPKGTEDPAQFLGLLISNPAETRRRIVAGFETMKREAGARGIGDASRCAAIGYCFGGRNVLDLARTGADVAAVVSVHGILATSMPAGKGAVRAAILVLHGAADPVSPRAHRDAFEDEMDAAGARWTALYFGNVAHAYTMPGINNPPVAVYNEPATRHGYALAHAFIRDAFAGKL